MSLIEEIGQLIKGTDLSVSEVRDLEYFVDNYIGSAQEGYIANEEYFIRHKSNLKPIWRKLKRKKKFVAFTNILKPHIDAGIFSLID